MASGTPDYWGIEDQYSPATDEFGRFIMIVRDPTSDNYAAVDTDGNLLSIMKGFDGALYRAMKVDEEGRIVGVMKGQADVTWELHGWWKFIASEQTKIKDYSGYANNGIAYSGVGEEAKYDDGIIGQALIFDGTDDKVNCGTDASLDFTSEDFTLECWIKPATITVQSVVLCRGAYAGDGYYLMLHNNGALSFNTNQVGGNQSTVSEALPTVDTWYHVVVVRTGETVKIYIDGVDETLVPDVHIDPDTSVRSFYISSHDGDGNWYSGLIDEVRVYGRALSQDEINWRYANTNPATGKPTRMVAVDTEGRMRVNVEGFPFKSRLMDGASEEILADGHATVLGDTVPMGKIWVIEKFFMWCTACAVDEIRAFLCTTAGDWVIDYKVDIGVLNFRPLSGPFILGGGDYFKVIFYDGTVRGTVSISWNGYELDTY